MELNPSGLQTWSFKPLTRPEQPEHSCRLQLLHSPITAEPYREKTRPLRPRRSCFAPAETRACGWALVEAPGAAPGSEWFIAAALYFHSRRAGTPQYRAQKLRKTGPAEAVWAGNTPLGWNTMNTGWPCGAAVLSLGHGPRIRPRLPFRRRIFQNQPRQRRPA